MISKYSAWTVPITLIVIWISLFTAGCGSKQKDEQPAAGGGMNTPVARVDNEYITVEELLHHPQTALIVEELIIEKLILKRSAEMGLTVPDAVILEQIESYLAEKGQSRREFLDEQHSSGLDFENLLQLGRMGRLQEQMLEQLIDEPTSEEVVTFLEDDAGKEYLNRKSQELEKPAEEITVEEVQDEVKRIIFEMRMYQVSEEGVMEQLLRDGHEVANLLRAAVLEDPKGEAWITEGATG